MPQAPQFWVLLRLASQPSVGLELQSANPTLQSKPQPPPEQVGEEFGTTGQEV
ncbi:MAG: hypothetical protein ACREQY_12560 [Candidatus Binatia bacterium]